MQPFHLLAFGAAALDASAGDVQLVAVPDQVYNRANSNYQIPTPHKALFAYAGGIGLARARIVTGSLRQRGFPQLYPLNATVIPPTPVGVVDWRQYPLPLRKMEDMRVDVTNGAANNVGVLIGVSDGDPSYNLNDRNLRALRFTATVTAVAFAWSTLGAFVFQDVLEEGLYTVYGMAVQGAAIIGARIVFQNQPPRPGCLGQALITAVPNEMFMGGLGAWGQFNTYSAPQIETFETGAGASNVVGWLLCGKTSDL